MTVDIIDNNLKLYNPSGDTLYFSACDMKRVTVAAAAAAGIIVTTIVLPWCFSYYQAHSMSEETSGRDRDDRIG
jgi:hypothetical protein